MAGADETTGPHAPIADTHVKEVDETSDAGSEDLEAESSGSEEEDLDEEEGDAEAEGEGEADADEDMEMGDESEHKASESVAAKEHPLGQARNGEVMVH